MNNNNPGLLLGERERIARLEKEDAARPVKENDDDDDWRREWETTKKVLTHRVTF